MQCAQCWNEIDDRYAVKCSVCNECFCCFPCLHQHEAETKFYNEQLEFQDEYPVANEPFGRYPWER